ncbi:MAG TPA: nucleoside triphosphate pyrophosphohydrolase family protein [Caldisericia bacterium]|nr:nucleoside triphosphate pyrophosphohydrolase family protein [Caldisericia bacterium]
MTLKEYKIESKRTCPNLSTNSEDLLHMALGMQTESAEISDILKKKLAYNKDIDWINLKEEIGDLMWYIMNLCTFNNFDLEEILQTNINKLRARFPEKFTEEKALNRDLKVERKILEE